MPKKTNKRTASKKRVSRKKTVRKTSRAKKSSGSLADAYRIKTKIFGVGGGGGNAISRMGQHLNTRTLELIAVNTDSQDLDKCDVRKKVHIGKNLTRGLGTGMNPELGRQAAEENRSEIVESVKGADLVFITAGLGGGTGSGASPIVAEAAKEAGALTIAIVTKPFTFEGSQRNRVAEEALIKIRERVDALIIVPNDRVFNVIKKDTPILKAFEKIDDILKDAIGGISELISSTGIINVDFSDVKTIMSEAGSALIGVGIASGQSRAVTAASQAINSPLLEFSIEGAQGILFGVSGGRDLKMNEVNEIAKTITATIDPSAKIIFGAYYDRKIKKGQLKVTLIATGFSGSALKTTITGDALPISDLFTELDDAKNGEDELDKEIEKGNKKSDELFKGVVLKPTNKKSEKNPTILKKGKKMETAQPIFKENKKGESKKKNDIWEIPAFLRRKKH